MRAKPVEQQYDERLNAFLAQIQTVEQSRRKELYEIMDMVPFRDLETALMIAMMEPGECRS